MLLLLREFHCPVDGKSKQRSTQPVLTSYLDRLTNAWRGNLTTKNESIVASAQLGRRDSSRMDALVLVEETDEFEVWEANGTRVIKKK